MKVGISRHEGMDAKKSDGFKCDKNNACYQNCVRVGPLSFISNFVYLTSAAMYAGSSVVFITYAYMQYKFVLLLPK